MIYMNMRNFLKPGDFVMMVPLGLHTTLQYNSSGNLEKVYIGYDSNRTDYTGDMIELMLRDNIVPAKIHITGGTSWVRGVLYTGSFYSVQGKLPNAVKPKLISEFIKKSDSFNFFAGTFESTSIVLRGATAVRQCLAMAKFKILPGWFVPFVVSETTLKEWLNSPKYTFMPIVTDYIIYRKEDANIISANLTQIIVNKVAKYVDHNGYVKGRIIIENSANIMYVDYSEVVRLNIQRGSAVVLNSEKQVAFCKNLTKVKEYSNILTCTHCGKRYEIPKAGAVLCPDVHCSSRLLKHILQVINIMHLPEFSNEVIFNWLKSNKVTCIPDIFLLDVYKDFNIDIQLSDLIRALVPISLIPRDDLFLSLAIACSDNVNTFRYYIRNPDKIKSDLGFRHKDLDKFITWLSDNCNYSDLNTLLNSSQICFISAKKKFEGAPIFRNKTIYLTGTFIRGSISEIASILQSYSAVVTTQFTNAVDCVLTGGTHENIDGKTVRAARALNKPIMSEDDFFKQYDIDTDLESNLE